MVLTGPNAGGKSTLLKAMMVAAVMAQSLCVAPCSASLALTPFAFLNSHVNVPDCKGRESLFEAEMYRARENLRYLHALQALEKISTAHLPDKDSAGKCAIEIAGPAFVILDEIFSSTNAVEGVAGAYAVAKHLVTGGNCICAVSTHFQYMCKLARRNPELYTNYRMPVVMGKDASDTSHGSCRSITRIVYPYRLRRGVCTQYIALELLRRNDFDAALLAEAESIKAQLLACRKKGAGKEPVESSKAHEAAHDEPVEHDAKLDVHDQQQELAREEAPLGVSAEV